MTSPPDSLPPMVIGEASVRLPFDPLGGLDDDTARRFRKYLIVRQLGQGWVVSKRPRYAGLVQVGRAAYWLEPPFSAASFVYLLLRHLGATDAADRAYRAASNRRDRSLTELLRVLAVLMVSEAGRLASGHVAQSYIEHTERLGVVKGRPQWHRQAGRPADGSVMCRYNEKTTNTLENQLILAGLDAAARWTVDAPAQTRLRTQQHVWRSLADPIRPARHNFDTADMRLNRLTSDYRPALAIARALLFGFDLSAIEPNTNVYAPVFDLAALFETLVLLIAQTAAAGSDLHVTAQTSERRAIRAGNGDTYRKIRPDIVVTEQGRPVLVVDSKFKPKYGVGGPSPTARNRVSREDIFQTFFYSNRVAQRSGLPDPVPAAIVSPRSDHGTPPSLDYRRIHWGEPGDPDDTRLSLLLVSVDQAVEAVRDTDADYCRAVFKDTALASP